jgi:hypothetical protein
VIGGVPVGRINFAQDGCTAHCLAYALLDESFRPCAIARKAGESRTG